MSNNKILKICVSGLLFLLILAVIGVTDSFNSLRWSVLLTSLILALFSFSSKRYCWGTIFLIFMTLFNPWIRPSFSITEWRLADIALFISLICWSLDYFRNYHKGLQFERLVRDKLFPKKTYVIVNATKDLHKKLRRFVESDMNPDFVFREISTGKTFAIECKYRSGYINGTHGDEGLWWKKDQGERYLAYGQKNNIPVYIIIGIGGNPKSPSKLAQIPVEVIQRQYCNFIPKKVIEENLFTQNK